MYSLLENISFRLHFQNNLQQRN